MVLVEVSPFFQPCPEAEKRFLECEEGVVASDLLRVLSGLLQVEAKRLSLVRPHESGLFLAMHLRESPGERVLVRGVRSLEGVPTTVAVAASAMPSSLTKAQALAIQHDTVEHYSTDLVRLQVKHLQGRLLDRYSKGEQVDSSIMREYTTRLRDILQPLQAKFFPKHGFEASQKGMSVMQTIFNGFSDDPEIQANVNKINALVGTDYAWMPEELRRRMTLVVQPAVQDAVMVREPDIQE